MKPRLLTTRVVPFLSLAAIGLGAGFSAGAPGPGAASPEPVPLPAGETSLGRSAVEASAIAVADALGAVPLSAAAAQPCPRALLVVSWTEPGGEYGYGAYIPPIGPAPDDLTTEVNGVVVCSGHPYAFMGFEAVHQQGRWDVFPVPYLGHEDDHDGHGNDDAEVVETPPGGPDAPAPPAPVPPPMVASGPIEGYAAYDPQRLCDPTVKPGTVALRDLLLGRNPGTRNLGITRACSVGGRSEHKEGRALDWGVHVSRPGERAAAEAFLADLLATDEAGNRHALARRMGVMYVIWNRQIWTAYRSPDTWRAYSGASPHVDHVHVSLSWAGALGRTSFWSGTVDPSTLLAGGADPASSGRSVTAGNPVALVAPGEDRERERSSSRHARSPDDRPARAAAKEPERAERAPAKELARAERVAARAAERPDRAAAKDAERAERAAARDAAAAAKAEAAAQRAERAAAKEAAAKEAAAQRKAARDAAAAAKAEAAVQRADRKAAKEAERARRASPPAPDPPPASPAEPDPPPPPPAPPPEPHPGPGDD